MNCKSGWALILLSLAVVFSSIAVAQQTEVEKAAAPGSVKFTGTIAGMSAGATAVTFALYREPTGGAPLWRETHSVTVDQQGNYTVYLGAKHAGEMLADRLPSDGALWLGVEAEEDRGNRRAFC